MARAKEMHWISVPSAGRIIHYQIHLKELIEGTKLMPKELCEKAREQAHELIDKIFATSVKYK